MRADFIENMHLLAFQTVQLFPDGTLFIHVALILVMIWVLNRTLYKPINRVIESREKSKGGHSSEAVGILKDVEAKEVRYAKEMLDARSAGYSLAETEHRNSIEAREQLLVEAKSQIADKFGSGKADLEKQSADARAAIGSDAEKIAEKIAANILKV